MNKPKRIIYLQKGSYPIHAVIVDGIAEVRAKKHLLCYYEIKNQEILYSVPGLPIQLLVKLQAL